MKLSNFKMSSIMSNRNAFSVFICMEAVKVFLQCCYTVDIFDCL